jgi:hypothetical protein
MCIHNAECTPFTGCMGFEKGLVLDKQEKRLLIMTDGAGRETHYYVWVDDNGHRWTEAVEPAAPLNAEGNRATTESRRSSRPGRP